MEPAEFLRCRRESGFRLRRRDAGGQTTEELKRGVLAFVQVGIEERRQRLVEIGCDSVSDHGPVMRRQHADYCEWLIVQRDDPPRNVRIATKPALPAAIAQDDGLRILLREGTSLGRMH